MTISQKTTPEDTSGQLSCPHCKAALPAQATFCGSCGERLKKKKQAFTTDDQDIHTRYRIKTLVRRYPYTNLYFALDHSQAQESGPGRMVAIRDIDISGLEKEVRDQAMALAQQEYDCLRRWRLPQTLACIDLRVFQGHIFLVASLPNAATQQRLFTLQDFLQSGLGLPREARTLEWVRNLGLAVQALHRHRIVLGDLDPYTVVLDKNSAQAEPRLFPFWLWPEIRELMPQSALSSTPQVSYFKAPEALAGKTSTRSDIYSLGALLYLLLTGTPPDESTLRHRRRLRTPREVNTRISQHVDDCVMRALAVEPDERFPNVTAFLAALDDVRANQPPRKAFSPPAQMPEIPLSDVETVRIVPLSQKDVQRWRTAGEERSTRREQPEKAGQTTPNQPAPSALPPVAEAHASDKLGTLPTTPLPGEMDEMPTRAPASSTYDPITPSPEEAKPFWPQRITNILPAIKPEKVPAKGRAKRQRPDRKSARVPASVQSEGDISLLKQIQRLILGQQKHAIEAAAIVETPMRVRPDQPYNLRMHIMGRDEPAQQTGVAGGLSALAHGEIVQVEVRSVLQQGYTYILQKASVTIPASGYAAEVTIPMQQQTITSTGRRDRLHIFFLDEQHNPLYEKPFVVEVFVSPLVQFGREGHQVLTIPL